jgi:hypothetical protein
MEGSFKAGIYCKIRSVVLIISAFWSVSLVVGDLDYKNDGHLVYKEVYHKHPEYVP